MTVEIIKVIIENENSALLRGVDQGWTITLPCRCRSVIQHTTKFNEQ